MNRADFGVPALSKVIDGGFDIFRGRTQGHENCIGVVGFVLGDQAVVASG